MAPFLKRAKDTRTPVDNALQFSTTGFFPCFYA